MPKIKSKTFLIEVVANTIIFVHTEEDPDDDEWAKSMSVFDLLEDPKNARALVYTDGASPNAKQRAQLREKSGDRFLTSVLTSSPLARAAGTAIRWFNPHVRLFAPHDIEGALNHLCVRGDERTQVRDTLAALRAELASRRS